MNNIRLEKISYKHKEEIYRIKEEYDKINDDYNGAFFIKNIENYENEVDNLENYSNGIITDPNFVAFTSYVAIDKQNKIVGLGTVRHELNDYLKEFGGHIGYSVVPNERKKGFGDKILKLLLEEAKEKNFNKVLLTCGENNIGSRKIIEKNGGILENKVKENGETICRFWIYIN